MKLKFIKGTFVGVRTYVEGEVGEFSEEQGKGLVSDGRAALAGAEQVETASTEEPPVETATIKVEQKAKGK